ncbi:MAG TPA: hypothetical protein VKH41_06075 [Myxococcota bacterium]|nr:hypothetical protein [Myxococcota bacterium]
MQIAHAARHRPARSSAKRVVTITVPRARGTGVNGSRGDRAGVAFVAVLGRCGRVPPNL